MLLLRRILPLAVLVLLWLMVAGPAAAETGSIVVEKAAVKTSPRLFSKTVTTLHYADTVEILSRIEGWVWVELADGRRGYTRTGNLSKPQLTLRAGEQRVAVEASDAELTLAGKGFDRQVENSYRQRNAELDYAAIDRMERYRVADADLDRFLREGGLAARPGGADAR